MEKTMQVWELIAELSKFPAGANVKAACSVFRDAEIDGVANCLGEAVIRVVKTDRDDKKAAAEALKVD